MKFTSDQPIQHVFVLMLENHSFDHLLGFSNIIGTDAVTGNNTKINGLTGNESNVYNNREYKVLSGAQVDMPVDPAHDFLDTLSQLSGEEARYKKDIALSFN